MVTVPEAHDVAVLAPWYAPTQNNVALHRYFDPNFIAQFQADVAHAPQTNTSLFAWQSEDRMGSSQGNWLKLRRPVHRTFHIAAWEASCQLPTAPAGQPPVAPEKIESAGFVIRYIDSATGALQGFQIVQGKPQGWGAVEAGDDPDAARQVKVLGLVPRTAVQTPGYTGEEVFPLHPLAVQDGNAQHTLLYGYLPIGGGTFQPATVPAPDTGGTLPEDLPWPFGLADRSAGPPPTYTYDQQIVAGQIDPRFAAVLRVLLGRYQLADTPAWSDQANAPVVAILDGLNFYLAPTGALSGQALRDWAAANAIPGLTLGSVLRDTITAQTLLASLMEAAPTDPVAMPEGMPNLLVVESVATQLRSALRLRLAQTIATSSGDMPIPKLASGPNGRYFVVPFARTIRPDGCERIHWGSPSDPFAVAAAFDPDAARPSLIEMPDLSDAKRGLARGASFDMPPALANLMNGLNSSAATQAMMTGGGGPTGGLGIRFICSFSLPVISICAMIMLSVTLNLLNIFLGWMAWVKNLPAAAGEEMSASLFVGWPLEAPDATGHLDYAADAQSLREALWNVLMTTPGERLMRPTFGAGLNQWIGQPNTETTRQLIVSSITAAIAKWEQRVTVGGVSVATDPDNAARVIVVVSYVARGQSGAPPQQMSLSLSLGGG